MQRLFIVLTAVVMLSCQERKAKHPPVFTKKVAKIYKSDPVKSISKSIIEKPTNRFEQPIGAINDCAFMYDCLDCKTDYSGGIVVYFKNNNFKKKLFDLKIDDFYLSEIKLLNIKNNYFIYVRTDHTYGHSQGYLYYLNTTAMKTFPVKIIPNHIKSTTDTLKVHKYMNLITDDYKTFKNGYLYYERQDGYGDPIYLEYEMILKRKNKNTFVLLCK